MNKSAHAYSFLTVATMIAVASLMTLGGDAGPRANAAGPAASSVPGAASMRAYLNPETGKVETGPAPSSLQFDPETENALRRDGAGLVEERRADGTVLLDLQGRFQSVSMVRRTADGKLLVCTDDNDRARGTLAGDIAAPATPEVK